MAFVIQIMVKYSIDLEAVSMVQKHTEIVTIFQ